MWGSCSVGRCHDLRTPWQTPVTHWLLPCCLCCRPASGCASKLLIPLCHCPPACLLPPKGWLQHQSQHVLSHSDCIALQEMALSIASVMRTVDAIAVRMKALSSPKASPLGRRLMQACVWPLGMLSSLTPVLADTCMACYRA